MANTSHQSKFRVNMSVDQLLQYFTMDYIRKTMGIEFQMKERKGLIKNNVPFDVILIKQDGRISAIEPVLSK